MEPTPKPEPKQDAAQKKPELTQAERRVRWGAWIALALLVAVGVVGVYVWWPLAVAAVVAMAGIYGYLLLQYTRRWQAWAQTRDEIEQKQEHPRAVEEPQEEKQDTEAGERVVEAQMSPGMTGQEPAQEAAEVEMARRQEAAVLLAEEKAGLKVAILVLLGLGVIAVILAGVLLGWSMLAVGAMVIFAYMILIGGPTWLAAIEDEEESERERHTGETQSNR